MSAGSSVGLVTEWVEWNIVDEVTCFVIGYKKGQFDKSCHST